MTLDQFLMDPSKLGMLGLMTLAIVGFMKGWIVTGTQYQQILKERDEFKDMVIRAADTTDRALSVAQKTAR